MHAVFYSFLGSCEEPPGDELCAARQRKLCHPISRFLSELPGSEEHPLGDVSRFGILD